MFALHASTTAQNDDKMWSGVLSRQKTGQPLKSTGQMSACSAGQPDFGIATRSAGSNPTTPFSPTRNGR